MQELAAALSLLSTAGDLGILAVVYLLWRMDRRLVLLEQRVGYMESGSTEG